MDIYGELSRTRWERSEPEKDGVGKNQNTGRAQLWRMTNPARYGRWGGAAALPMLIGNTATSVDVEHALQLTPSLS